MKKSINFSVNDIKLTNDIISTLVKTDAGKRFDSCYHGTAKDRAKSRDEYIRRYVKDNSFTYSLCMYTWDRLWDDALVYGSSIFIGLVQKTGLIDLIRDCDKIAGSIIADINNGNIRTMFSDDTYLRCLESLLADEYAHDIIMQLANGVFRNRNITMVSLLQLLKYPKRICIKDDFLLEDSIDDFIRIEQRNRALDRQCISAWLLNGLRSMANDLFGDFTYESPDMDELAHVGLPTGSTYFGMLTKYEKLALLISEMPEILTPSVFDSVELVFSNRMLYKAILPCDCVCMTVNGPVTLKATKFSKTSTICRVKTDGRASCFMPEFEATHVSDGHFMNMTHRAARVVPVPKSYKAARIIAMEHPINYMKQKHLAKALDRFFRKSRFHGAVNIHSQQHSVDLCREAALTSQMVTIDHSHASDTVRKSVIRDILPQKLANAILSVVPDYIYIRGELRPLSMLATSGCACTFNAEIVLFYIIARFATEISGGDVNDLSLIAVYGDDVIIPAFAVDAYLEIASRLGLIVNVEKSFTGDDALHYREACGAEYIGDALTGDVYDAKCVYYPRRFLGGSLSSVMGQTYEGEYENDLTALVSLQHHLFNLNIGASDIVAHVIKQLYPKMTSSPVGTQSSDIWEVVPDYKKTNAPYKKYQQIETFDQELGKLVIENVELEMPVEASNSRQIHSMAVVNFDDPNRGEAFNIEINGKLLEDDLLQYRLFLFYGPEYADGLMKLLNVSQPRRVHLYRMVPMVTWNERKI